MNVNETIDEVIIGFEHFFDDVFKEEREKDVDRHRESDR